MERLQELLSPLLVLAPGLDLAGKRSHGVRIRNPKTIGMRSR
jgi:hypothetical protein